MHRQVDAKVVEEILVAEADAGSSDYSVELRIYTAQGDARLGGRLGLYGVGAQESTTAVRALPCS